jgi:type VI secretion system ImpC/EvpB family protein
MPERLQFDVALGRSGQRRSPDTPMRLLLVGDFSGESTVPRTPLAERRTRQVDFDTLDDGMERFAPRVRWEGRDVLFRTMDDFHPDRLFAAVDVFQELHRTRSHPPARGDNAFDQLLGRATQAKPVAPASALDALIHRIVAPHIVSDAPPEAAAHAAAVDAAMAEQMRALLHFPAFQSLEAAWRGVHWVIGSLELDETLQLHLFDVTREELVADITSAGGNIAQTGLYHALVNRWRNVPGAEGWSAIATLMRFGSSDADIGLLAALGLLASQASAPLLTGGDDSTLVGTAATAGWQQLRRSEVAQWIAMAAPRVLLRLPYGPRRDAIEAFPFEEIDGAPRSQDLLWGSGSLALLVLLGRGFRARGWDMSPGDERDIDDLPAYTFERDGEPQLQPCAERFLTEREIDALLASGVIPIASRRDRNAVVAIRFQSISDPPAPLVW